MQLLRFVALGLLLALTLGNPARAVTLLRDPDIEYALDQLAAPVLKAAGLSPNRTKILVIDDSRLNAFVVDRESIFLHSGLILKMKNASMLQAVIAHEAAHISNGHLTRRLVNARNARSAAGLGLALAAAAAAAGGGDAAAGIAFGATNTAQRVFMAHTRAEESSADNAGVRYLARAGIDPQGAVDVLEIFRGQETLADTRRDPYARTHPMSSDRYRVVKGLAGAFADKGQPDPTAEYWFARAKSKLSAFLRSPKWTLTRAGEFGHSDITYMRQAIAYHRSSNLGKSLPAIDKAVALRPKDPFLHDLRGQILMESRKTDAAVATYARAVQLAPNEPLILGSYGRALLADGQIKNALQMLEKSRARDGRDTRVMRDLAVAYAKLGDKGMASVVTAERYAMQGRLEDAAIHAKRASDLLPRGSGAWQRAQDVLSAAQTAKKRR